MTLTASSPSQGWNGVYFAEGSTGALTDVTVERVAPYCPSPPCAERGFAAVTAYDATVTLSDVIVSDNDAAGVRAAGDDGLVTINGDSEIRDNTGPGVTASGGGDAVVGGTSKILHNGVGLLARGAGSRIATTSAPDDPILIQGNFGPGVSAELGGTLDLTGGPDNPPS